MNLAALAALALVVGVVMGTLGGGGAILTVPILVYLAHLSPHEATSGSLVIVALSAIAGAIPHHRRGNVRLRDGVVFGALGSVGAIAGSRLSSSVPESALMLGFAVLLLVVAGLMVRKLVAQKATGAQRPTQADQTHARRWPLLIATATGVGLLTGFFGVGGGFVVVPALTLALGFTMPVAVGTSLVVIVVNCLVALGSRVIMGVAIDWRVTLVFAAFAVVGSLAGARFSARIPARYLTIAFATLLVAVGGFVGYQQLMG